MNGTTSSAELRREAQAYYALCDRARALGIPTSLDDPRTPETVDDLRNAVASIADGSRTLAVVIERGRVRS